MIRELIFWDVDTQYDFMMNDGKLYVPNAEEILPNLEKLYNYARKNEILIELTERLLATLYIPQIIKHVQMLYRVGSR